MLAFVYFWEWCGMNSSCREEDSDPKIADQSRHNDYYDGEYEYDNDYVYNDDGDYISEYDGDYDYDGYYDRNIVRRVTPINHPYRR